MSIPNLIHKIKSKIGVDKTTILFLFIIVGVGISSFGLGRLSVPNSVNVKNDIVIADKEFLLKNSNVKDSEILATEPIQSGEKMYVASKNGKMYYSLGCGGAKRIKKENEVWFNTKEDAEKSGFTMSSTCK